MFVAMITSDAVSIHALTRSATDQQQREILIISVSIHALTRSATFGDRFLSIGFYVSIHALTRSATEISKPYVQSKDSFNPRTHEECDAKRKSGKGQTRMFQSTHSRGVRPFLFLAFF